MCTVSVIAAGLPGSGAGGFRVVCNRDESRERSQALLPHWRTLESSSPSRAIWPTDSDAGGTWIAANDLGLVLCLLNFNPTPAVGPTAPSPVARGLVSRGLIIPELIASHSPREAIDRLGKLDLPDYSHFRLVAIHFGDRGPSSIEAQWDRSTLLTTEHAPGTACFTSSGLGDQLVAPRLALFDELVRPAPSREAQDRFHRHVWPERPHLSVMMSREDARTVSVTTVEVARMGARVAVDMRYREATDQGGIESRPLGNWAQARSQSLPPNQPN